MAVVAAPTAEIIELPQDNQSMDLSPDSASNYLSESSSFSAAGVSDPHQPSGSPSTSNAFHQDLEIQSPAFLRSEEYRQLFRLPSDEVLIEDFNCALQENILIQGHVYLFVHYICFYSNIFGFETKKIIPLQEITTVRKAKTAGIFPNAIEIFVGEKKYFFASFLSRDEAFNLINDGWLRHVKGTEGTIEKQETRNESGSQDNGILGNEKAKELDSSDSSDRRVNTSNLNVPTGQGNTEDENGLKALPEVPFDVIQGAVQILDTHASPSRKTWTWRMEDLDAPKVPNYYTKVAETTFPIKVEDFFSFYFSDDAADFIFSYHEKSGDKGLKCSLWRPDDIFGHTRELSFQHPINLYFGSKFGSCQEIQKFRVYRDSHLVIEVSQEISEIPYSDYFHVETRWDLEKDAAGSNEGCILRVHVNVVFSKRTVWKGKIVQTTIEECREAYGVWMQMANEFLKQKLEKPEEGSLSDSKLWNSEDHHIEEETNHGESLEKPDEKNYHGRVTHISDSTVTNQQAGKFSQGVNSTSVAFWLREYMKKLWSLLQSHNYLPLALFITFAVILLMQLSIVMLLSRPQHIHVSSSDHVRGIKYGVGRSSDAMAWLEKRMHHLKDEMYMVEARLEMMRREHAQLKAQLRDLEELNKSK